MTKILQEKVKCIQGYDIIQGALDYNTYVIKNLSNAGSDPKTMLPRNQFVKVMRILELNIKKLANIDFDKVEPKVAEQIEVQAKYSGYIKRQEEEVERNRQHEQTLMPKDMDYVKVRGLSTEVIEKLSKYRPINLGQASRIQGITPAAISLLRVYLKKRSSSLQQTA